MITLAFDSSGISCAAAVVRDGKTLASFFANNGFTHSRTLLPAIERVLSESGTDISEIDKIAVTVGPGSFTGVKIGAATAKGLAVVRNTACAAVSTMAALACGVPFDGLLCPVMDARRGMFYNALFRCENGAVVRVCEDRQISGADLMTEINGEKVLVTGDGAELFAGMCAENGLHICRAPEILSYIRGENIVKAAESGFGTVCTAETLCASYLRPPQAERERLERMKNEHSEV